MRGRQTRTALASRLECKSYKRAPTVVSDLVKDFLAGD
jgi:hypothetical protein